MRAAARRWPPPSGGIDRREAACFSPPVYTIIGGDGREYGPVPTEQVRAWMASGRADLGTKARELGSDEWKTLGDFPDFAAGPGRAPAQPPGQPAVGAGISDPRELAETLLARAGPFDVFSCYERGWALLKVHFWPLLGASLLIAVVSFLCQCVPVLGLVAALALGGVFTGGLQYYYLKKVRGEPTTAGDVFSGFTLALGPLILGWVVSMLITGVGFVLLILPGIYLIIAYQFTYLLILDKKLDFWTAMEVSRRVITARWWAMFGLFLLGLLFAIIGVLCLFVGVFVASVLVQAATIYAYEDLCNPKEK